MTPRRALALLLIASPATLAAEPVLPTFDAAAFASPGANRWFDLTPGLVRSHADASGNEASTLTITGPGPVILGVPTITLLDEAWEEGRIVERTFDYLATDAAGNLWYFGEDVTNFRYDDAGLLTGTDDASAWRAGVNGARPGILFPADPVAGMDLFQEHAPADEAMDHAEVIATGLTLTIAGQTFAGVVQTFESSTVEPDLREFKYWAPGLGVIRAEEGLSADRTDADTVIDLIP